MKRLGFFLTIFFCCFVSKAQKQPIEAKLTSEDSFSMILLADPQSYVKFDVNQPLFELQTAWAANNIDQLNILTVLCTGDLVEQNELLVPDGVNGNQTSREQWESVSRAFERLDNKLPYVVATGNHDYGYVSAENRQTRLSEYFTPERNNKFSSCLVDVGLNAYGYPTLENAAYEFNTTTWGKLLVISLEFAPRNEALEWANKVVNETQYRNHKVILLTHSYLDHKAERFQTENYKLSPANYGKTIWEQLVYPNPNVRLVLCGHECNLGDFEENVSYRKDKNKAGKTVAQMMFNAQTAGGGWFGNGGDGWLRILEFRGDGKTIEVKTFSPLFAISPTTAKHAWRTNSYDQFTITLE